MENQKSENRKGFTLLLTTLGFAVGSLLAVGGGVQTGLIMAAIAAAIGLVYESGEDGAKMVVFLLAVTSWIVIVCAVILLVAHAVRF